LHPLTLKSAPIKNPRCHADGDLETWREFSSCRPNTAYALPWQSPTTELYVVRQVSWLAGRCCFACLPGSNASDIDGKAARRSQLRVSSGIPRKVTGFPLSSLSEIPTGRTLTARQSRIVFHLSISLEMFFRIGLGSNGIAFPSRERIG
jgi:hypothetical protein